MRSSKTDGGQPQSPIERRVDNSIVVGILAKAHGLQGEVRITADPSMAELLQSGTPVVLSKDGHHTDSEITACRGHGSRMLLTLRGVEGRDAAEALSGTALAILRENLPALEEGQYYDSDLIGARLESADGRCLGSIREVLASGANDVYVVRDGDDEILVPAVAGIVLQIDIAGGRVVVDPSGLVFPDDR